MEDNIQWQEGAIGGFVNVKGTFSSFQVATKVRDDDCVVPGRAGFVGKKVDGVEYHVFSDLWRWVPRPAAWNGEGLPPVGTKCTIPTARNAFLKTFEGRELDVVMHDVSANGSPLAVFRCLDPEELSELEEGEDSSRVSYLYHGVVAGILKPIRTPEQIAAEQAREKAKMLIGQILIDNRGNSNEYHVAGLLYDAGLRLVEGGAQ